MKLQLRLLPFLILGLLFATTARADVVTNDLYGVAPGLGNGSGFFLGAGSITDVVFDGASDQSGTGLVSGTIDVTETVIDNGDNTETIFIEMVASNGELFPAGFTDGTNPLDLAGFFMGANMGADPLDFDAPAILANSGVWGLGAVIGGSNGAVGADLTGPGTFTIGPFNISGFGNFTAGPGGGWDGSLGVNLGAGVGLNTSHLNLWVTIASIPEPGTFGVLGVVALGLGFVRRRN